MSILRVKTIDESLSNESLSKGKDKNGRKTSFHDSPLAVRIESDDSIHSCNSSDSSSCSSSIKFDKITIRNYNRTITDNPSCSSGAPIGLSWEYDPQHIEMPIDTYESIRDGYRRSKQQMQIPENVRFDLLRNEFNVPVQEIVNMTNNVRLIQRQRIKTATQPQRNRTHF